ncbi:MAG TPA: hypothetical protein PKV13_14570, partial [Propionicimonas sp.]|nr:hypothetical protein [Propionicimonas sp.]
PQQPRGGGSLWLGLAISVGSMLLVFLLTIGVSNTGNFDILALLFGWPLLLLVGGLILAAVPKTSRTGGGVLLGLGAGILILGGVCFAMIATSGL